MSSLVSSVGSWACPVCLPRLLAHEGSTRLPTKSRGRDFAFCMALSLKALTFSPKACYPPFSTKKNPLLLMCPIPQSSCLRLQLPQCPVIIMSNWETSICTSCFSATKYQIKATRGGDGLFQFLICSYVANEARKTRCQKSEVAAHTAFHQGGAGSWVEACWRCLLMVGAHIQGTLLSSVKVLSDMKRGSKSC